MADSVNTEYQVNIPVFEGPMDLLLHLVTKNRIDIHDIPIQSITSQYLDYLNAASEFDLELGSSFFAMASTLLLIKSRVLLPKRRQEETGDESEQEDPAGTGKVSGNVPDDQGSEKAYFRTHGRGTPLPWEGAGRCQERCVYR